MESIPVAPTGPGERAVLLPWFWPDAAAFHAVADSPMAVPWTAVRADPGPAPPLPAARPPPWVAWTDQAVRPIVRAALAAAHFAELIADATEAIDPARAWAAGWLAYAGWLAV